MFLKFKVLMFQILGTKVSRFKIFKVADLKFQSQSLGFQVLKFQIASVKHYGLGFMLK
jgi:hypothetical protein